MKRFIAFICTMALLIIPQSNIFAEESDYEYDLECGIGDLKVGGNFYGGVGNSQHISNPDANRHMNLECGIGKIEVVFAE